MSEVAMGYQLVVKERDRVLLEGGEPAGTGERRPRRVRRRVEG
jgi:hypothetical protein